MPMSALLLIEFLNIKPGQWLIQNAANGAVGESMAMLAPKRHINTINLVRSKESEQELIERAASGKLKLPTGGIYTLDNIKEAVSGKVQSGKKGKVLLKP